jgi:16S rRNA (cytidine1402-2'-O)-methyltransferase
MAETLGDRKACVARELTKLHEQVARGTLRELAAKFAAGARGEITIVVDGVRPETSERAAPDLDGAIRDGLAAGETTRQIASRLSTQWRLPRREIYARTLAILGDGAARSPRGG